MRLNTIVWEVERIVLGMIVIADISLLCIFGGDRRQLSIAFLVILIAIGSYVSYCSKQLLVHVINIYALIVGPVNIIIGIIKPVALESGRLLEIDVESLFQHDELIWHYTLILCLFYIILVCTILIFPPLPQISNFIFPKLINVQYPLIVVTIFAFFEYWFRVKYNLRVPGKIPTIPMAGVFVYLLEAIDYYFIFIVLYREVLSQKRITFEGIIKSLYTVVMTHYASIRIGARGSAVRAILVIALVLAITRKENRKKNHILLVLLIGSIALYFSIGFANLFRIGEFSVFGFLLQRFTGLFDGLIVLINTNECAPLYISNYFENLLLSRGITANFYYTHNILGFPLKYVHSNATPSFIAAWMYGGVLGVVVVAMIEGVFWGIAVKKIQKLMNLIYNDDIFEYSKIYVLIMYIMMLFASHIVDGNITVWKIVSPSLMCYILLLFTKIDNIES